MINSKKDLERCLKLELGFYGRAGRNVFFEYSEREILAKHIYLLRHAEYYQNTNCFFRAKVFKFLLEKLQNKYALHVPLNTCGEGLKIMHVGPILINGKACIGKNCSLHINTGIVATGGSEASPVIGDSVIIGIGAAVIGDIFIANSVVIGANAVVTKSFVEENITIAGAPARVINNRGSKEWERL